MQWEAIERETLAYIGVLGAARAQGADVEIPSISDAKAQFDEWLIGTAEDETAADIMLKRALGLKER